MTAKISVILPVYNSASWLCRCLDSICGQTLKDIEIICVDDGSTDESAALLQEYALRDDRVLHIGLGRNQGVAVARNVGMAAAGAPWLSFVDSDDSIDEGFLGALYEKAENGETDMVCAPIRCVDERNIHRELPHRTWVWSSLFRADFLREHGITFPGGISIGEDNIFLVRALMAHPVRRKVHDVYYNYFQRSTSTTHHPTDERCRSCVAAFSQLFSEVEQKAHSGAISAGYAQLLVRDSFQVFLTFITHRFPDTAKHHASAMLVEFYGSYPYLDATTAALQHSEPALLELLAAGDVDKLATYLLAGHQRFAAGLRARLKKRLG